MLKFEVYGVIRRGEPVDVVGVTRRQGLRALSSVIRILNSEFRVWGARLGGRGLEFWDLGAGVAVRDSGLRVQCSGFGVYGLGVRNQGLGFIIQDLGFRVQGSGFRAWSSEFLFRI